MNLSFAQVITKAWLVGNRGYRRHTLACPQPGAHQFVMISQFGHDEAVELSVFCVHDRILLFLGQCVEGLIKSPHTLQSVASTHQNACVFVWIGPVWSCATSH